MIRAAAAALLLPGVLAAAPARAEEAAAPLVVCLEENLPPLSLRKGEGAEGFDVLVARRVAALLGRPLGVQWFETEADPDSRPDREANALLSDGRCQLVGGFLLSARSLGRTAERSKLPDFAGARQEDRRRWVALGTLAPAEAYRATALGVVLGPRLAGQPLRHLAELQGARIGVEERTLADAILTTYRGGMLVGQVAHVAAGPALFEGLARGDTDAVLVEVHRWDAWQARHPGQGLVLSGYRHPIGFNFGFVGLGRDAALLAEVSGAVGRMLREGEMPELARQAGLTYVAPRPPGVSPPVTRAALQDD